jgi:hypothetical protein
VNTEKMPFDHLIGITACLALALAAHVSSLPLWVLGTIVLCAAIRLVLGYRNTGLPSRWLLMTVAGLAIALLWLRFRTFSGLAAGTALLALMAGLKLLETRVKRDFYIITLIIYFLCIAALLNSESFWLLGYLVATCWITTGTLMRVTTTQPAPPWSAALRYSGRLLLQALPLMLILWLLFPRFSTPLWQFGNGSHSAESGLSDSLNPGDITDLAQSDEVASPRRRRRRWSNTGAARYCMISTAGFGATLTACRDAIHRLRCSPKGPPTSTPSTWSRISTPGYSPWTGRRNGICRERP